MRQAKWSRVFTVFFGRRDTGHAHRGEVETLEAEGQLHARGFRSTTLHGDGGQAEALAIERELYLFCHLRTTLHRRRQVETEESEGRIVPSERVFYARGGQNETMEIQGEFQRQRGPRCGDVLGRGQIENEEMQGNVYAFRVFGR